MPEPDAGNLLAGLPEPGDDEFSELLRSFPGIRLERIVSHGNVSPEGFWYDQDDDEWVVVIAGEAELEIEGERALRRLRRGDWLFLPAHCRHRVVGTAEDRPTVWLAVHVVKSADQSR
jgi:cupin 2 domain-containing protein